MENFHDAEHHSKKCIRSCSDMSTSSCLQKGLIFAKGNKKNTDFLFYFFTVWLKQQSYLFFHNIWTRRSFFFFFLLGWLSGLASLLRTSVPLHQQCYRLQISEQVSQNASAWLTNWLTSTYCKGLAALPEQHIYDLDAFMRHGTLFSTLHWRTDQGTHPDSQRQNTVTRPGGLFEAEIPWRKPDFFVRSPSHFYCPPST